MIMSQFNNPPRSEFSRVSQTAVASLVETENGAGMPANLGIFYKKGFRYFQKGEEVTHKYEFIGMAKRYEYWIARRPPHCFNDWANRRQFLHTLSRTRKRFEEDLGLEDVAVTQGAYGWSDDEEDEPMEIQIDGYPNELVQRMFASAEEEDQEEPDWEAWKKEADEYWSWHEQDEEEQEEEQPAPKEFVANFYPEQNVVEIPSFDSTPVFQHPFKVEEMHQIIMHYSKSSPYFRLKHEELKKDFPEEVLLDLFNKFIDQDYMMYKKGTLAYWSDQFFFSRRRRDQFVDYFSKYKLNLAVTQGDEVLEATSSVDSTGNMTFVNERPVDSDSTHTGGEVVAKDPHADMGDTQFNLNAVLGRDIVVYEGQWSSQGQWAKLKDLAIPKCITDKIHAMTTSQLRLFGFGRFGVEMKLQMNGTKFHCGRIIAALFPLMWEEDDDYYSVQNWTAFPHIFLDASVSNSGTLFVPFTHLLSHFPMRSKSLEDDSICSLGRLRIAVFNKLRIGEGAASVLYYTVYARLVDPEMHQTVWPIERFSFSDGLVTADMAVTQGGNNEGFFKGILSRGLSTALGAALTTMTGGLSAGIGGLLTGLIFDKPLDPLPAPPMINRSVNAPCHGAGVDNSVRLTLCPISQTETTEDILGGTTADFNIRTLCSIPMLLFSRTWEQKLGAGALFAQIPMCPTYIPPNRGVAGDDDVFKYEPTMLAYVSRAHVFRRGSMKLKVQVIGTAFHSGRLMFVYDPTWTPYNPIPDTIDHKMNLNTVVVDIQEQQEFELEIPYISPRPWLRCDAFRTDDNFKIATDPDDQTVTPVGTCANGMLFVHVLNSLVAPSNVSQDIDVNFYLYGGPDYELAVPTPLDPLSLVIPGEPTQFGELEDYPFKIPRVLTDPPFFDNQDMIVATYYEGKRLFEMGKIFLPAGSKWYQANRVVGWGSDSETLIWLYKASILSQYADQGVAVPQYVLMESMPVWKEIAVAQGLEEYTTTRDNEIPSICMTKGFRSSSRVAAETVSENAMNLQTQMRRYYPYLVSVPLFNTVGFTLVSVPVSPSLLPQQISGVNRRSEPIPIHQIAWYTRLYTYRRGSLRYIFMYSDTESDVYCWYNPSETFGHFIRSGYKECDIQKQMAFAGNMAVSHLEGALQVEVPFQSPYNQVLIDVHGKYNNLKTQNGTLFFAIRNGSRSSPTTVSSLSLSIFMSTGDDFVLNVVRPPPLVFEPQKLFSNCEGSQSVRIRSVEAARNLGDNSRKVAIPGSTGVKSIDQVGSMQLCKVKEDEAVTQGLFGDAIGITKTQRKLETVLDNVNDVVVNVDLAQLRLTQEKLNTVLDGATSVFQKMHDLDVVERMQATTTKMGCLMDGFVENVQKIPEAIDNATRDTLTKYTVLTAEVMACAAVLYSIRVCLDEPSVPHFLALAISVAGVVGLAVSATLHELIRGVIDWVMNISFIPEQARAQALFDGATADTIDQHAGKIAMVVAVIGTVFYSYIFGIIPEFAKIKKAIRSFFEDEPVAQGLVQDLGIDLRGAHFSVMGIAALDRVYSKIVEYIKQFINWVLDKENPEVIAARTTAAYQDRILALVGELDELEYEPTFIEAMSTPMVHNRFYRMMTEASELTRIGVTEKLDSRVMTLITECRKRALKVIQRYEKECPLPSVRYDPFVICFYGDTGTGKTKIMGRAARVIQDVMGLSDYNLTYSKNISDRFWSRYCNQPIVLWDEFAQNREADKIVAEFMTLKGSAPVSVNMSESTDKGRPFTSQAIIMTTNAGYVDFNTIRDNIAFKRRRLMMIKMEHRPGFDVDVLQNAAHDAFPNWEHCNFQLRHNVTEDPESPVMGYQEMMERIRERCVDWHANRMAELEADDAPILPRGIVVANVAPGHNEPDGVVVDPLAALQEVVNVDIPRAEDLAAQFMVGAEGVQEPANPIVGDVVVPELNAARLEQVARQMLAVVMPPPLEVADGVFVAQELPEDPALIQGGCEDIEDEDEEFHWCPEPVAKTMLVFKRAVGVKLSIEEEMEAELFMVRAKNMSARAKLGVVNQVGKVQRGVSKLFGLAKRLFVSLKNTVVSFFQENPRLAKVLGVLTLLGGVGVAMYGFSSKKQLDPNAFGVEGAYESGPTSKPAQRVRVVESGVYESGPQAKPTQRVRVAQGATDPVAVDIKNKVHGYVFNVRWPKGTQSALQMKCLQIGGSVILVPFHFLRHAVEGEQFELLHRYHPLKVEFQKKNLVQLSNYDWCLYDCGPRLEPGKKLLKYFVKESDLTNLGKCDAFMLSVNQSGVLREALGSAEAIKRYDYADPKWGEVYSQKGWKTNFATESGDCGSLLLASSKKAEPPGKVVGIHVAGKTLSNEGFCVVITRELLEQAFNLIPNKQFGQVVLPKIVDRTDGALAQCRIIPSGDYTICGRMPNSHTLSQPIKTSFKPTPFYQEACSISPEPKKPAYLHPFTNADGERVSPLKLALEKYGVATSPFPAKNLAKVEFFLKHYLKNTMTTHTGKRIWSVEEAVNGIDGVDYADRLNMRSSPGWPYQIENKRASGKAYLFNEDGSIKDPLLKHRVQERIDEAKNCERVKSLWRDCLKDELRPVEKVESGKTRLFNIAPVDFTIVTRMFFMDFIMAFYSKNCDNFFSAVGMNPESFEWTKMYDYLREVSSEAIGGDFKGYDGTIMAEIFMLVARVINFWYGDGEENANVRETLFMEIIHTLQLCENCVYCSHQGNPSGNPLTVVINTIVNLIYMLLAWLEIYPDKTIEDFFEMCRIVAYGDDNVVTVHHSCSAYNQSSITKVLAKYGITYTTETKDASDPKFRDLDSITFLKRGFRRDNEFGASFILPTMSCETLNSYLYYYRDAEDVEAQLRENMRAGLQFAAFHGETFYDQYFGTWSKLMLQYNFRPVIVSWREWVDNFLAVAGAGGVKLTIEQITSVQNSKHLIEGFETFMNATNSKVTRTIAGILEAPVYYLCAALGLGSSYKNIEPTDDRWAVSIPSGEGKSTLAKKYPHIFVDHDELLLPLFSNTTVRDKLKNGLPWSSTIAREHDFDPLDRRILLVHHPDNTKRKLIGSVITHFPTFIRSNIFQRLTQPKPYVMKRDERNAILLQIANKLEPQLFEVSD